MVGGGIEKAAGGEEGEEVMMSRGQGDSRERRIIRCRLLFRSLFLEVVGGVKKIREIGEVRRMTLMMIVVAALDEGKVDGAEVMKIKMKRRKCTSKAADADSRARMEEGVLVPVDHGEEAAAVAQSLAVDTSAYQKTIPTSPRKSTLLPKPLRQLLGLVLSK